jgi:hypothetical protein
MTFLRDPVDRAVSAFYHFQSLGREKLAEEQTTPGLDRCCDLSLDEFLEAEPHAARVNLGNIQTWMFSQPRMYPVSPWRLLTRADLDEARRNLERVAFVGVTARFEESIRLLCRMWLGENQSGRKRRFARPCGSPAPYTGGPVATKEM